jgi:phospholipid/cholesterol/gamma-HCH transport system substrate-binding protein
VKRHASLIKLTIFLAVSALFAGYLAVVIGDIRFSDETSYYAMFENSSGLTDGNPVRIAGVEVGTVSGVGLNRSSGQRGTIRVSFTVESGIVVPRNAHATVRFKNLVGDRYLEIEPGTQPAPELAGGGVLPVAQTSSSLDLDALYSGFKPLFQGLDPAQINRIAGGIINVLQGQTGAVYALVANLASLTGTLARNDQLLGAVIDNLDVALATLAHRSPVLGDLVDQLQALVSGLAAERAPIGNAVQQLAALAGTAAGLLSTIRPGLRTDVNALDAVARTLNEHADTISQVLQALPHAYRTLQRVGSFGSFFNFYLCGLRLKLTGPTGPIYTPFTYSDAARCAKK